MKRLIIILILITVILLSINALAFSKEFYTITTATSTGDFYASGIALAQVFNEKFGKELDMDFSAMSSSGSAENLDLLMRKEAELALMQNNIVLWAYEGIRKYEGNKFDKIRMVLPLFDSTYHFLVKNDINSLSEIRGRRFVVGRAGSGTETSSKAIFEALGITYDDFEQEYLGHGEAANALRNGLVDGVLITASYPAAAVAEIMFAPKRGFKILSISDEEVAKINKAEPWIMPLTIPANTYTNQPEPIKALRHSAFLVTTDEVSEKVAYLLTKTTWENLDWLKDAYDQFGRMDINHLDEFFKYPVPIHPGAIKYYKEVGVFK